MRRWRDEIIALLAAKAPRLDRALHKIANQGGQVVLSDDMASTQFLSPHGRIVPLTCGSMSSGVVSVGL